MYQIPRLDDYVHEFRSTHTDDLAEAYDNYDKQFLGDWEAFQKSPSTTCSVCRSSSQTRLIATPGDSFALHHPDVCTLCYAEHRYGVVDEVIEIVRRERDKK